MAGSLPTSGFLRRLRTTPATRVASSPVVCSASALDCPSFSTDRSSTESATDTVVTPLSGTYAGIGQQVKWGLELALKEINDAGGVNGKPVVKIDGDSGDTSTNIASATVDSQLQKGVDVIRRQQVCGADDGGDAGALPVLRGPGNPRHIGALARPPQGLRPVGKIAGHAFDEDGGLDAVAISRVRPQFVQQVGGPGPRRPEVMVRVEDPALRVQDGFRRCLRLRWLVHEVGLP